TPRVALTGVAFGPPMSIIRHRFGGNLRAARASVLRAVRHVPPLASHDSFSTTRSTVGGNGAIGRRTDRGRQPGAPRRVRRPEWTGSRRRGSCDSELWASWLSALSWPSAPAGPRAAG